MTALELLPLYRDTERAVQTIAAADSTAAVRLCRKVRAAFNPDTNGNLAGWIEAWQALPDAADCSLNASSGRVTLTGETAAATSSSFPETLRRFHPWRKGPFQLFDQVIDTEWRSDWKWERLSEAVELRNRTVLDIGCGNGYFGWRMLDAGAGCVVGIDPFLLFVMQHQVLRRYISEPPNYVLPLIDEDLQGLPPAFEVTFSMGVLYHRVSPIGHLQTLFHTLQPGGRLVLETLILDQTDTDVLVPAGRYARMRNVWFIPTVAMLQRWLQRVGFRQIEAIDVSPTTTDEQRSTDWMTFESLPDFLDPQDASKTIEGYPGPVRAILTASK